MCGIAGFSISEKDFRKIKSRNLAEKLLLEIVARGEDATGAAWTEKTKDGCEVFYAKEALPAELFVQYLEEMMPRFTRTAILHTRYATKGTPLNNFNNHPIVIPDKVVGVHNGIITNDDELFALNEWQRMGQVDSEAIFQLIADSKNPCDKIDALKGRAAIAWFDIKDPQTLHLARLEGSPLFIGHTENESLIFASTEYLLKESAQKAGIKLQTVWEVPEWFYIKVRAGKIIVKKPLKLQPPKTVTHTFKKSLGRAELFPLSSFPIKPYHAQGRR